MRALRYALVFAVLCPQLAAAQDPAREEPPPDDGKPVDMPSGPAEIFNRAQQRRDSAPPAGLPSGHPPVEEKPPAPAPEGQQGQGSPVGNDPHASSPDAPALARKPIASTEPNPALPPGTIRVRVVDAATERPVPNAQIQLGTMNRDNTRTTADAKASGAGEHTFAKLATGDGQAYRVNVMHDGAKFSSMPFRLPTDQGFDVTIRQLQTTRDPRELVLYVGATSIELRDERLKIVQQARLINIGSKAFVFPEEGQLVKLPQGFTAFQSEELMTDQRMTSSEGEGFKIRGSVPPGEITLTWGFDVPTSGTEMEFSFELPWTTFAYRVLADAAPGMSIAVEDMPEPVLHEENGRRFWVSEIMKRVGEPPLRLVKVHVRGIPGPGPLRIIATIAAILVLIAGAMIARRRPPAPIVVTTTEEFERRKAELVARAKSLAAERERGEIGPEFHAEQLAEIEEQLAALLYEQSVVSGEAAKQKAA